MVIDGPVTATLNVQALIVASLSLDPDTIPSGGSSVATVSLSQAAPVGGARVFVSSDNPSLALPVDDQGVPITEVMVPAGSTTATFNVKGLFALNGDQTTTIHAYRGPSPTIPALDKKADITVQALTYTLQIIPNSVFGGASAQGKITLSAPAIAGFTTMNLTCSDNTVTFTQPVFTLGSAVGTFSIQTPIVADTKIVTFTTWAGTLPPVTASLTIKATEPVSVSILPSNRARQRTKIQIQVTVNRNVPVATGGKITFSNPSLVTLPANQNYINFTVPQGSNKAIVTLILKSVPRNLSTTVTATCSALPNGVSASTTLFVLI